jgi:hypothetical protein
MRKLYLVPIVLIAMIAAPNAFARDLHAPCHYLIKPSDDKPKHGEVTCYACNNIDDFSNVGAAHTVNNHKYDSLDVKNGNKVVRVKSDTHYVERGITINLGPFIGWNWERHDRSHQSITSYMVSGSVSGRPWNSYPISDEAALAKCEAIPEEEEEAIKEMREEAEQEPPDENPHDPAYLQWLLDNVVSPKLNPVVPDWGSIPRFSGFLITYQGTRVCTSSRGYLSCS